VEGVSCRVVWVEPATARGAHRHPHSPEVVYVVQGSGIAWQDGERTVVGPGDVVFVPTGVPHATLPTGGPLLLVCFFPHPDLGDNIEELEQLATAPE
jgi:mannose-6-phosphate isomerase-like protein (cupin superfamily)